MKWGFFRRIAKYTSTGMFRTLFVVAAVVSVHQAGALLNGAALKPPMGWQNWNGFGMDFNATLFRRMAAAMKANGMLDAGYTLMSAGGSTYPHTAIPPWNSSDPKKDTFVIVRNATGHYQIDPARFPGPGSTAVCLNETALNACIASGNDPVACGCANGNEGMRALSNELRKDGFQWGSYSNMAGCQVAACNIPALNASATQGFVQEDYDLMVGDWGSSYIMVDVVGLTPTKPHDYWSMMKFQLGEWAGEKDQFVDPECDLEDTDGAPHQCPLGNLLSNNGTRPKTPNGPVILHDCHNYCASTFSGPTLAVKPCQASNPSQQWDVSSSDNVSAGEFGFLRDGNAGLCVGCFTDADCANTALTNASGRGAGMEACLSFDQSANYGNPQQQFNFTAQGKSSGLIQRQDGSCLGLAPSENKTVPGLQVVVLNRNQCNASDPWQQWTQGARSPGAGGIKRAQLHSVAKDGYCLSPTDAHWQNPPDPWCANNNNMWRSNTDSLQQWPRLMQELESLVGLGTVSKPMAWGFADSLEIGVPGLGCLTWEESKSHLALWACTSQPLFLSNDVRPGSMQQRVLNMLINRDMLAINQEYHGFAGDRMWSGAVGKELWAKPLGNGSAAVVLLNRDGYTSQCQIYTRNSLAAPCDDNVTESSGAQPVPLMLSALPAAWLGLSQTPPSTAALASASSEAIECDVVDVFGTVGSSISLGRLSTATYKPMIPPHGSMFLQISNCKRGGERESDADTTVRERAWGL